MSTRSLIGQVLPDGTIRSIYCHYDGYPKGVGATLELFYRDSNTVSALLDVGDISSLRAELVPAPDREHTYNNPQDGVTVAYGRDREESGTEAREAASFSAFETYCLRSVAFAYLFRETPAQKQLFAPDSPWEGYRVEYLLKKLILVDLPFCYEDEDP